VDGLQRNAWTVYAGIGGRFAPKYPAFEDAIPVKVRSNPDLELLVVSPASLVALKLIAWQDRPQERARDAIDIGFLINHYLDAGNNERFFEDHDDIIASPFDYVESGARLLGRDIASLMSRETISYIVSILEEQTAENSRHLLIQHMINRTDEESQFDVAERNLAAIRDGIRDITGED
jgi:predicted nucleotidyltransferase